MPNLTTNPVELPVGQYPTLVPSGKAVIDAGEQYLARLRALCDVISRTTRLSGLFVKANLTLADEAWDRLDAARQAFRAVLDGARKFQK